MRAILVYWIDWLLCTPAGDAHENPRSRIVDDIPMYDLSWRAQIMLVLNNIVPRWYITSFCYTNIIFLIWVLIMNKVERWASKKIFSTLNSFSTLLIGVQAGQLWYCLDIYHCQCLDHLPLFILSSDIEFWR